jgi:proteasome maturation protein
MPALSQSNVHLDILMGRDEMLDVADFFGGKVSLFRCFSMLIKVVTADRETDAPLDIHSDMEKKKRI